MNLFCAQEDNSIFLMPKLRVHTLTGFSFSKFNPLESFDYDFKFTGLLIGGK